MKIHHYEKELGMKEGFFFWREEAQEDMRWPRWQKQQEKYGFDDREIWGLNTVIAAFVYPRLKMFAEHTSSVPVGMTVKGWREIVEKMAHAFEIILRDDTDKHFNKVEEGLDLFREYFFDLWD